MNSFIWISEQMIRISPWKLGDLACWSSPSRGSARRAETRRGSDRFCLEFPLMFSLSFYNVKVGKAAKPYSYQSVCGSWAPISGQRWKVCPSSGLRWTIERSRDSPLRPARLRSQNYRRVFYTSLSLPPPLSPLPFTYPLSSSLSAFLHSLSLSFSLKFTRILSLSLLFSPSSFFSKHSVFTISLLSPLLFLSCLLYSALLQTGLFLLHSNDLYWHYEQMPIWWKQHWLHANLSHVSIKGCWWFVVNQLSTPLCAKDLSLYN